MTCLLFLGRLAAKGEKLAKHAATTQRSSHRSSSRPNGGSMASALRGGGITRGSPSRAGCNGVRERSGLHGSCFDFWPRGSSFEWPRGEGLPPVNNTFMVSPSRVFIDFSRLEGPAPFYRHTALRAANLATTSPRVSGSIARQITRLLVPNRALGGHGGVGDVQLIGRLLQALAQNRVLVKGHGVLGAELGWKLLSGAVGASLSEVLQVMPKHSMIEHFSGSAQPPSRARSIDILTHRHVTKPPAHSAAHNSLDLIDDALVTTASTSKAACAHRPRVLADHIAFRKKGDHASMILVTGTS